jgi:hypothetical protein
MVKGRAGRGVAEKTDRAPMFCRGELSACVDAIHPVSQAKPTGPRGTTGSKSQYFEGPANQKNLRHRDTSLGRMCTQNVDEFTLLVDHSRVDGGIPLLC